jgi:lipid-A-disaccharide synthase
MPGSRRTEVGRLLPVFGATLARLRDVHPDLVAVVPVASAVAGAVTRATAGWTVKPVVVTDLADKHDAFAAAAMALTKSGTSTLELALAGVPMAVTYRVNRLTGAIARRLIRVAHVAMVNILAGRRVVPELIQQDCTPERLAATVCELLGDSQAACEQRAAFGAIMRSLAPAGGSPSQAAAAAVLELLGR